MVMVFTVKSMCKEQLFKSHNSTLILPIHYLIFLIGRIIPQTPTSVLPLIHFSDMFAGLESKCNTPKTGVII